jgi:hypothetical protein
MVEGRKHIRLAETGLGLGRAVVGHFLHMPAHGVPARERLRAIDMLALWTVYDGVEEYKRGGRTAASVVGFSG